MGINFKDALGVHADALALRADRTRVLAANIANENTQIGRASCRERVSRLV